MMKIFTIAVILSVCKESNLKSRDKLLALQPFKLDSSLTLRMTAMVSFKFTTIYGSKFLNLMALEVPLFDKYPIRSDLLKVIEVKIKS